PATQLARVLADLHHPNDVAVLLLEQADGALALRILQGRLVGADGIVLSQAPVGDELGLLEDLAGDRLVVAEVEAQTSRLDQGSGLPGVLPQEVPEGPVDDVRGRV